jgi:hypothetical protein
MPDVIGDESPPGQGGPGADLVAGPLPGQVAGPRAPRGVAPRDFGGVLSAATIMPVMPSAKSARRGGIDGDGLSSVLVPAYFRPGLFPAEWAALSDPRLLAVVLNVDDGPGDSCEPEFVSVASGIAAAGSTVIGYVDAGYGARSIAEIETAARRHRNWYGVAGIFLDQVPAGSRTLGRYRAVGARLRAEGAEFIVFNHGVYPDPGYADVADLLVTFEGPWTAYQLMDAPPAWARGLPAWQFCHLVYGVPATALDEAVALADERGAGVLYVTDRQGVHSWNGLPGYFAQELTLVCGE